MASRSTVAKHLGISADHVTRLHRIGVIPAPKGSAGYDVEACRIGYINALRAKIVAAVENVPASKASVRDQLDRAKLEKLEMENAVRRREYAPISLFEVYCEKVGAVIHSHFEALAGQVKQRIPHLRAAELAIIRNELAKCASGIADFKLFDDD